MSAYIYNMGLRFKEMASAYPDYPALCFEDVLISYRELDEKSDRAAAHLRNRGLRQGDAVAIFAEKQPMTYVCLLAALKIGAPYVVLDMMNPASRLAKILEQCKPRLIISERSDIGFGIDTAHFTTLEETAEPIGPEAIRSVCGAIPAYLIFTSGSTGFPKGVAVSHASMLNFVHWTREQFSITPQDRITNVNPLYFDNSIFDLSASLFNGACLKPVTGEIVRQAGQLVKKVSDCTVWFSVPSLLIYLSALKALTAKSWPHMRAIIFGGEGFAKAELKKLYQSYGKQAAVWNVYGPTECTCICSAYAIGERDFEDMSSLAPLGRLAVNIAGAVMNLDGTKELPDGEAGELYLFGPQVAIGYCNDSERTRTAFAPSPLPPYAHMPCYRTGDLVRRDPKTAYYHFVGRKDNQIKHMGYRIELEEIESALHSFSEVVQAAVVYIKSSHASGRIVAFATTSAPVDAMQLVSRLRDVLPSYMIPESLHIVGELPKNANGKVDRRVVAETYMKTYA